MSHQLATYVARRLVNDNNLFFDDKKGLDRSWILSDECEIEVISTKEIRIYLAKENYSTQVDYVINSNGFLYLHDNYRLHTIKLHYALKNRKFLNSIIKLSGGKIVLPVLPNHGVYGFFSMEEPDDLGNRAVFAYYPVSVGEATAFVPFQVYTGTSWQICNIKSREISSEIRKLAASYLGFMYDIRNFCPDEDLPLTYESYAEDYLRLFGGMEVEVIEKLATTNAPAL